MARLTKGLMYCAGIGPQGGPMQRQAVSALRRTRWPSWLRNRPQWCAPPQASITTSVGDCLAKNASSCSRLRLRRRTGRSRSSTPWSVKTCLEVSMAMRLSSTGRSLVGGLTNPTLALDAGGPSTPTMAVTGRPVVWNLRADPIWASGHVAAQQAGHMNAVDLQPISFAARLNPRGRPHMVS
jgi:hypothetical protein